MDRHSTLPEQLTAQLQSVATRGWSADTLLRLRPHLLRLLSDTDHLTEIAARSQLHPNGFMKIVLDRFTTQQGHDITLRLHRWPDDAQLIRDDPHSHRWAYASAVITGAIIERVWNASTERTPGAVPKDEYEYRSEAANGHAYYTARGPKWLELSGETLLAQGSTAWAVPSRIHSIEYADPGTTTLFVTGNGIRNHSTLYRPPAETALPQGAAITTSIDRPSVQALREAIVVAVESINPR